MSIRLTIYIPRCGSLFRYIITIVNYCVKDTESSFVVSMYTCNQSLIKNLFYMLVILSFITTMFWAVCLFSRFYSYKLIRDITKNLDLNAPLYAHVYSRSQLYNYVNYKHQNNSFAEIL